MLSLHNLQISHAADFTVFKIHVDASFDINTNECGSGMVLYNTAGECTCFKGTYATGIINAGTGGITM